MHKPITIMQLREGLCACVVPVEPFPMYCGLPATRNYRMCEHHASAYLEKVYVKAKAPTKPRILK